MLARFLKPAELEVDEAIAYFDEQRDGLGDRFETDLLATVAYVTEHPQFGKAITGNVRKFKLRTFPYNIIYVVDNDDVVIVAVAHRRRRPGYWLARLTILR